MIVIKVNLTNILAVFLVPVPCRMPVDKIIDTRAKMQLKIDDERNVTDDIIHFVP